MGRAAAILIDMQQDVVWGRWWSWFPPSEAVLQRCVALVEICRSAGIPVIYTAVEYRADGSNTPSAIATGSATPTEYLIEDTPGVAIVPELAPAPGELVAVKNLVSAFTAQGLNEEFERQRIDTVLVAGLAVEGGVNATVVDAHARGMHVTVVADCCAAFDHASYQRYMSHVFPPLARVRALDQVGSDIQNTV